MAKHDSEVGPWTVGLAVFAGLIMLLAGIYEIILGLAAIVNKNFFVVSPNYVYGFDVTSWGWIHLLLGIILAFAGWGIFSGNAWARGLGIFLAFLSATANFFFIPYYPVWSIMIIILNIGVIAALARFSSGAAAGD